MSDQPPPRLSGDQVLALKFAAHRQLARWSNRPKLSPRQHAQRTALTRAVRILQDHAFAHGCELHAASDERPDRPAPERAERMPADASALGTARSVDPQRTPGADACVDTNPTQLNERAVDETLDHLVAARMRADTSDELIAKDAWREITCLAGQLQRESRLIARAIKLGARRR